MKLYSSIFKKIAVILPVLFCVFILPALIIWSEASLDAAKSGLDLWLSIVLPTLLPFMVCAEVFIGTGLAHSISILLEPLTVKLFRVPGYAAFIWVLSALSGYPMAAKLTAEYIEKGSFKSNEAQVILSFASTAGPVFMLSAVGTAMLGSSTVGIIIVISHYTSAVICGVIAGSKLEHADGLKYNRLKSAVKSIYLSRTEDESIGTILGYSITKAMGTMLLIGGYIIVFSVITALMGASGITAFISKPFILLLPVQYSHLPSAVIAGLIEMTNGSKTIASLNIPMIIKGSVISFILGWSGFSIHGQVTALLSKSGIKTGRYIIMKLVHGLLSAVIFPIVYYIFPMGETTVFAPTVINQIDPLELLSKSTIAAIAVIVIIYVFSVILRKRKLQ